MSHGDQRPDQSSWPPPHPSPPLPPLRGSGVPGAPPSLAPYVAGAVAVVLVIALVIVLVLVTGDRGSDEPTSVSTSAPTSPATSSAPAGATCWDGSPAASVEACSLPTGRDGLAWVFPAFADARCGEASGPGGDGVVTRVLCLYRMSDGTRARLGLFEWASVPQGAAFYDSQGMRRSDGPEFVSWSGTRGRQVKLAALYAAAPYSLTVTYPAAVTPSPDDQAALALRPTAELRGLPAE